LSEFFEGLINNKIVDIVLDKCNISNNSEYNSLSLDQKKFLCNTLNNFTVNVVGSKSFDSAQVCTGGVDTCFINPETMESTICSNLYVIGELLDVDGICGGYNLGFAWLSGIIAGRSVGHD
jgi:predicted flavoprotein YhiN